MHVYKRSSPFTADSTKSLSKYKTRAMSYNLLDSRYFLHVFNIHTCCWHSTRIQIQDSTPIRFICPKTWSMLLLDHYLQFTLIWWIFLRCFTTVYLLMRAAGKLICCSSVSMKTKTFLLAAAKHIFELWTRGHIEYLPTFLPLTQVPWQGCSSGMGELFWSNHNLPEDF